MADFDAQPGRATPSDLSATQREADEMDLRAGLTGVAGLVADARPVGQLLGDVAEFAAHAIPGVDGVSIALLQPELDGPQIQMFSATADFVAEIDGVQYEILHEGPCITAMRTGRAAVSGSLGSDDRWLHFGGRVARMGVHSALSLPLVVGETVVGAVNSYARARDAFGDHAVELGSRFAASASVSVYNAQLLAGARERTERLQRALGSRAVIDQAIGILRSRSGATAEEAFDRLKRLSQADNVKLVVVAEQLVNEAVRRARARNGR
ncbi:GAF and ANTAR domain-containing protein [Mycobacterium sp. ITM-2016-00317]|uniref:GAF and ANTAR domain-containing protein n=1 Tax=Mycobacterium sp. ITM-2016-00317 TaxID=2099694 RepID=UPI000D412D9B|nr:GAF and ANTAR domain-containing protein [Mycobacterium sp. ITM-2016-00317]WNG88477.1 GAF and ANTAR domain-containing protein [Mycobacterium sp. ITM-2016-00317]